MSQKYNFKNQKLLLEIALQICEDYDSAEFSVGGVTLLSAAQLKISFKYYSFS